MEDSIIPLASIEPATHRTQKPAWLTIRPPTEKFTAVKAVVHAYGLHTVCQEAHCPNMSECWSGGTATFMIMGDVCTRGCRFCSVKTGRKGTALDPDEPEKLASALLEMKQFDYVVITSVDRDDLPDQGASHIAACIRALHKKIPGILIEVLIPDFRGDHELLKKVIDAKPTVIAHNIETVARLQRRVRDLRATYEQSMGVLRFVKDIDPTIFTKSSLMLGLGESEEELLDTMRDLRAIGVDILTMGQYLRPSSFQLPVHTYIPPEKFKYYEEQGVTIGFLYCAAGPFIRSSYRAGELFLLGKLKERNGVSYEKSN